MPPTDNPSMPDPATATVREMIDYFAEVDAFCASITDAQVDAALADVRARAGRTPLPPRLPGGEGGS